MNFLEEYKRVKKIEKLYDWQTELLHDLRLIDKRQNFVLSLPTGAGKSLIAEVLIFKEAIVAKKSSILVLPYVAIVQEKVIALSHFETEFGLIVEDYSGGKGRIPPIRRRNSPCIYICTIEKANILVNSFVENGRLNEVGLIIIDELHMLSEGQRGATLEQCLCKLLIVSKKLELSVNRAIQMVGMSATLSNTHEIVRFLEANLFTTHFRPVRLVERVKIGSVLYRVNPETAELKEEFELKNSLEKRDPDGLSRLLDSIVPRGSVLIFCPTRQSCENVCKHLASLVPQEMRLHRAEERRILLAQLKDEHEEQICPILQYGISAGIIYHHSGLTSDERLLIETAYKSGVVSVVCATSTLAAGVNLPARRVIIRSPFLGRNFLKKSQYLQMVGRAGRAGLDEKGDSIVLLHPGSEVDSFKRMISDPLEPCVSHLHNEHLLEALILDLISLKICHTRDSIISAISTSLFAIQLDSQEKLEHLLDRILNSLVQRKMIVLSGGAFDGTRENKENGTTDENSVKTTFLQPTQLGSATFNANICPQKAENLRRSLKESLGQGLVLSSHFHLLYTVVPGDVEAVIDWNLFYNEYMALSVDERRIIHAMSLPEAAILQLILTGKQEIANDAGPREMGRIYVAFMLRRIWMQEPIWQVAKRFNVSRGWLQQTLQSACSNSGAVVRFAERTPELWSLRSLLPEMVKRLQLSECRQQELIPLLSIDCVKRARAQMLYKNGLKTVASIAKSSQNELMSALDGRLSSAQARRMITSAKALIRDQVAEKIEELEELGASCVFQQVNFSEDSKITP